MDNYASELAKEILIELKKEFNNKHLSKSLLDTIFIIDTGDYVEIHIPAPTYNMLEYQKNKVIVKTYHGSYASQLDTVGSEFFVYPNAKSGSRAGAYKLKPHNHKDYLNRVIWPAIDRWVSMNSLEAIYE